MILRRLPTHLNRGGANRGMLGNLRSRANLVAALYGAPVYLVGSALLDHNDNPRDWDIRVMLPDDRFEQRYGPTRTWHMEGITGKWTEVRYRWSTDCVRESKDLSRYIHRWVDFQVYPRVYARHAFSTYPKLRLDRVRFLRGETKWRVI